ncbi:hypothetical protein ACRV5B_003921 [Citrobacter freundii]|uniref:Uncharacterized protein n=1 Tax=Citrobacter freundii TaxID=546 RepID=A0AAD2PLQ1_CITFR|nr:MULTISPECIES: hypothetical protein [Citrobacter]EJG2170787.1 hypothetical protein [Citrobacter freundii 47N]EJY9174981.1 hypothetical protein [Citrobacter freundii]EKT9386436.1 hypothetical protein [Citrobacter freundii]EKU0868084.1 hypothetical protein [Citrobacter freundii]EKU1808983.1 hypothetical protein [Citrobacter freundii]
MDNCLQPVWTVAWQKRPDGLFWWDKKKLSLFFDIYQLTKRPRMAEILLAFSSFSCLHHHDTTRHCQCAQNNVRNAVSKNLAPALHAILLYFSPIPLLARDLQFSPDHHSARRISS